MADKLGSKEMVSFKELLFSNVYAQEALIELAGEKVHTDEERSAGRD